MTAVVPPFLLPNSHHRDYQYRADFKLSDCLVAIDGLPPGEEVIGHNINAPFSQYQIPHVQHFGQSRDSYHE